MLRFPVVTICNLNEFRFSNLTRNDMYYTGEFLGFLTETRKLHLNTIPKDEIENQEEYKRILERLEDLSNFDNINPRADFNMFEFYNRTGIQINQMLLSCSYRGEEWIEEIR